MITKDSGVSSVGSTEECNASPVVVPSAVERNLIHKGESSEVSASYEDQVNDWNEWLSQQENRRYDNDQEEKSKATADGESFVSK